MRTRFSFSALGSRTCPKVITKVTPLHFKNEQHRFVKSVKLYWGHYDDDVGSVKHIVSLDFQLGLLWRSYSNIPLSLTACLKSTYPQLGSVAVEDQRLCSEPLLNA